MLQFWDHFRLFLDRRIRYKITRAGLLFTVAILVVGFVYEWKKGALEWE